MEGIAMKLLRIFAATLMSFMMLPAQAQDGLKIHISVDLEGIAGAVTGAQLGTDGFEYQRFRELHLLLFLQGGLYIEIQPLMKEQFLLIL